MGGGVGLILAVGLISACSGQANDATSSSAASDAAGGSAALTAELAKGPAAGTQNVDRQVVYTGSLTIRVADAEKAADQALGFAEDVDGYVGTQDSQLEGEREVKITLRVPADEFDEVMAKAAGLGTVQKRSLDSDDVTDQVVDLEGRLENAKASTERLRELLSRAENIDNIATLEDRLTQREAEIEQILGQLEVIESEVQYATVRLTLTEKEAPTVSDDLPGPLEALRAGAVTVVNLLVVLAAGIAFLLPFVPFVLLGWFGFRAWRKRHPKPTKGPFPSRAAWPGDPLPPPPDAQGPSDDESALGTPGGSPVA